MESIPYRFETTHRCGELSDNFASLPADSRASQEAQVAGRAMRIRNQGAIAFIDLVDDSGTVQLVIEQDRSEQARALARVPIGSWVGAVGTIGATRRGTVSLYIHDWAMLAVARRSFPDKHHGLSNPDQRYRQRYVDTWANPEVRDRLRMRFEATTEIRRHLNEQGFLEVETPVLHPIPGGANARAFDTHHRALDQTLHLRIAPELYLKRLVVAGFERVFELGRVFRNEGISTRHNPEFTMLEIYAAYSDYQDMMELTEGLVSHLAREFCGSTTIDYDGRTLNLEPPWERTSMSDLVSAACGEEVHPSMPAAALRAIAARNDVPAGLDASPGQIIASLYEQLAESSLWGPVFVCDYPADISPLARPHREDPHLAERFEAIVAGRELANAYSELTDPAIQLKNFEAEAAQHLRGDEEAMLVDADYVRALEYGLPPTGGLGIGIDRLMMILTNTQAIREIVAFPTLACES